MVFLLLVLFLRLDIVPSWLNSGNSISDLSIKLQWLYLMVLHAADGHSRHLVPSVIGFVIIIGGKSDGARLHGIRGPFLGKPYIGDGSYAVKAAVSEPDATRKERETRGVAAEPRTGLDRGSPPPRMLPHSCWFITCQPSGQRPCT